MCKTGDTQLVQITPKPFHINVDRCIADEIAWLNSEGVRTLSSCCGHGTEKPKALIDGNYGSLKRAEELDYVVRPYHDWTYEIELKGGCWKNGRN